MQSKGNPDEDRVRVIQDGYYGQRHHGWPGHDKSYVPHDSSKYDETSKGWEQQDKVDHEEARNRDSERKVRHIHCSGKDKYHDLLCNEVDDQADLPKEEAQPELVPPPTIAPLVAPSVVRSVKKNHEQQ